MEHKPCTDFLFAQASFVTGVASVINVVGNFYEFNHSSTGDEADARAIESDWKMVGRDLEIACEKEYGKHVKPSIHEFITQ